MFLAFTRETERNNEILSIQYLRGIAALMVTVYHYMPWLFFTIPDWLKAFLKTGSMGVYIFFCISGFVLTFSLNKIQYTIRDFGTFLKRRFIRIEPPYLVSVLMVLLFLKLRMLMNLPVTVDLSLRNILFHIGYLNVFGGHWFTVVYWTLAIEFMFYITIGLLYPYIVNARPLHRILIWTGLMSSGLIFPAQEFLPNYFPFFILGMTACLFYTNKSGLGESATSAILCLGLIFWKFGWVVTLYCGLTSLSFFVTVPRIQVLYFLGTISFSIYLMHTITGARVLMLGFRFEEGGIERPIIFLLAIIATIVTSWLYYLAIEKRSLAWSRQRK